MSILEPNLLKRLNPTNGSRLVISSIKLWLGAIHKTSGHENWRGKRGIPPWQSLRSEIGFQSFLSTTPIAFVVIKLPLNVQCLYTCIECFQCLYHSFTGWVLVVAHLMATYSTLLFMIHSHCNCHSFLSYPAKCMPLNASTNAQISNIAMIRWGWWCIGGV